jgi:hypothetical protein
MSGHRSPVDTGLDDALDAAMSVLIQVYREPKFTRAATCWQRTRKFTAGWHAALWQAEGVGEHLVSHREAEAILRGRAPRLPPGNASEVAAAVIAHIAAAVCRAVIARRELDLVKGVKLGDMREPQIGNMVSVLQLMTEMTHHETPRHRKGGLQAHQPKRKRQIALGKLVLVNRPTRSDDDARRGAAARGASHG